MYISSINIVFTIINLNLVSLIKRRRSDSGKGKVPSSMMALVQTLCN